MRSAGRGGVALAHTDYTWSADNGNVYVGSVVNTLNPGASQVQSKNTQILDSAGNLTVSAVYEYGNLVTPARTYNYSYLTDANYTNRWTRNRVTQVTMNGTVLVTNTYDGYTAGPCSPVAGLTARTGLALHDDTNFGLGFAYRGNLTRSVSVGGVQCLGYETTGVVTGTMDGAGRFVMAAPSSSTNYSLPGVLTPGGNANLQTSITYADSWAVTSLTGPNGANGTTTYDSLGRPQSTRIPDGAVTDYTYAGYQATGGAGAQQTATLGTGTAARWKRTSLDGFGRVVRVESGNGASTNVAVSQVDTEYGPCACSPLGKLKRVSMPHAGAESGMDDVCIRWQRADGDGDGAGRERDADGVSDGVRELHGESGKGDGRGGEMEDPAEQCAGAVGAGDRECGERGGPDYELHVRHAGAFDGSEHAAEQRDADADIRVHGGGPDERDESGERDGDVSVRRVAQGDEADGCQGTGDAVHVRCVR